MGRERYSCFGKGMNTKLVKSILGACSFFPFSGTSRTEAQITPGPKRINEDTTKSEYKSDRVNRKRCHNKSVPSQDDTLIIFPISDLKKTWMKKYFHQKNGKVSTTKPIFRLFSSLFFGLCEVCSFFHLLTQASIRVTADENPLCIWTRQLPFSIQAVVLLSFKACSYISGSCVIELCRPGGKQMG